jgi:acetoin:2,6-dichlorophenolindophenol oxidoreductase subunit alpha
MMALDAETRIGFYRGLLFSRAIDDALVEQYWVGKSPIFSFASGPLPGELHSSRGQEPVGVGVCSALSPDDFITTGHRPHHVAIARGVDAKRMVAEIMGKATGLSGGVGGHMHLYDPAAHFSSSGIIAEGMGPVAGMALARKMQGLPGIGVTFIGNAAVQQGAFHEVLNMVSLYKIPYICVIEDNKWGVTTNRSEATVLEHDVIRAESYGMVGELVPGNDVEAIHEATLRAVKRAREENKATLLEVETVRLDGHFIGDPAGYIKGERKGYQVDPIPLYRDKLIAEGVLDEATDAKIVAEVQAETAEAIQFGLDSPYPETDAAFAHVFAA